eukprot:CAMPEP_0119387968 /NCGR_PEP_ID=MMETSP1334-20130426/102922_1 /TAXON_ID=127549 /ORGANISM="Calcidiscus leptoporus, Strain RCC1130" /LENGTH=105 /DNA_ID=CAMNT_0007409825 /DNA_START=262 /DNA_END=579 /DNA_ORIENTATION=+
MNVGAGCGATACARWECPSPRAKGLGAGAGCPDSLLAEIEWPRLSCRPMCLASCLALGAGAGAARAWRVRARAEVRSLDPRRASIRRGRAGGASYSSETAGYRER